MSDWQPVAKFSEIPDGSAKMFQVGKEILTVFRKNETLIAVEERCPHRGGPLSEGQWTDTQVKCPWHSACFDLKTGKHIAGPSPRDLRTYPVRIEKDVVEVQLD